MISFIPSVSILQYAFRAAAISFCYSSLIWSYPIPVRTGMTSLSDALPS